MNLNAFDIPESHDEIAAWIENVICAGDLRGLVTQLAAVHGTESASTDLATLLSDRSSNVMANGLGELPADQLHTLLSQPTLLLELQQLVIQDGGEYWQSKFVDDSDAIESTRAALDHLIALESPSTAPLKQATQKASLEQTAERSPGRRFVLIAIAATGLIAVSGLSIALSDRGVKDTPAIAGGWGWNKPIEFTPETTPTEYLDSLADGAKAWFNKPPQNAEDLKQRLSEFSQGCRTLAAASHEPLPESDASWLKYKCRIWQRSIDNLRASLSADKTFDVAKQQADDLAIEMEKAIRQHGEEISG